MHDLTIRSDPEANLPRSDPDSPAGVAMAKIRLVYGVQGVIATLGELQDIIRRGSKVTRSLGSSIRFEEDSPSIFRKRLEEYADSSDQVSRFFRNRTLFCFFSSFSFFCLLTCI